MKPKPTTQMSYNYFISDSSTCNVLDSTSNPISSMYVYLNGANNGTTNSNGQKFIYFNDVNCDTKQNLSIRCSNNQTRECAYGSSALDFDNYEISIKTVKTTNDNTTLRLKHINSDYSDDYKDAIVNNTIPVVIGNGFWSNLFTLQDLGIKLATSDYPRNVWLIEYHGGPTTDCDNCIPYTYQDQVNYFWPALISGVETYSGQSKVDYVGYSHGGRLGLDSLSKYKNGKNNSGYYFDTVTGTYQEMDLAQNSVNHFISVVTPGALDGSSGGIDLFKDHMDDAV